MSRNLLFSFLLVLFSFSLAAQNDYYWVGGSGYYDDVAHWASTSGGNDYRSVQPGPTDNVYFDENSGFTEGDNTVILRASGISRDIIFSGTTVPVTFTEEGHQNLHIYGSSVWQEGMTVDIQSIYYENTNEPKTIRSNGVRTGKKNYDSTTYFKEQESISLLDDFSSSQLNQTSGIWNTNGHDVTLGYHGWPTYDTYLATGNSVLNLSTSDIFLIGTYVTFNTNSVSVVINPGTSHIHFTESNTNSGRLVPYSGQVFYDVSFESSILEQEYTIRGGDNQSSDNPVIYNKVEFFADGVIEGYNEFETLILHGAKNYEFEAQKKQTIEDLQIRGTPCDVVQLRSTQQGQQAEIEVIGEQLAFNFVNIRDIKVIGEELFFDEQSTDAGNNTNIYFEPYFPGSYNTYLGDWECYIIDENDPSSYTLSTRRFYGYENTDYEWHKKDEETGVYGGVISTEKDISIHPDDFGPGTYKVTVTYHERPDNACIVFGEVTVPVAPDIPLPEVNPNVCEDGEENTLADILVEGENIRWYLTQDSEDELPLTTEIQEGETYYVTQQPDVCESARKEVVISIIDCAAIGELSLIKIISNRDDAFSDVGDVVEYEITLSNIGEGTVFNINITDDNADNPEVGTIDALVIGASETFTAAYTITQQDIDVGYVSNLAVAEGVNEYDHVVYVESQDNNPLPDIPSDPDCENCTIAPVRQGPTAMDDSIEVFAGVEITISVLENDEEGNSAILPELIRLIDLANDQEVEELVIAGQGAFTAQADGTITFQSETSFDGTVTPVDYIIYDENNLFDQATIHVTVIALSQPVVEFEYAAVSYCQLEDNLTPILSDDFTVGGTFTATPEGLDLDTSTGVVELENSQPGVYQVTYIIEQDLEEGIAGAEHTVQLEIIEATSPEITFDYGGTSFCLLEGELTPNLQGPFIEGGIFSASSTDLILDEITGTIDLTISEPGVYEITYTVEQDLNECRSAGEFTVEVEIVEVMEPVLDFNYSEEYYCMGAENAIPQLSNDFIAGGTFTSFPVGLVIDSSSGIIDLTQSEPGYYEVTYAVEESLENCYNAGEYTVMVGVEESSIAIVQFEYEKEAYCSMDEFITPILSDDFTEGGIFSATPNGIVLDSFSGTVDLQASAAGIYEVTYSIEENLEECIIGAEHTVQLEIIEATSPEITFDYGGTSFCLLEGELTPNLQGSFTDGGIFTASSPDLMLDEVTGIIDLTTSAPGVYNITYTVEQDLEECRSAGEFTIEVEIVEVMEPVLDFSYSEEYYCMGAENAIPQLSNDFIAGGTFTSFPVGLAIDSSSGIIDLTQSEPGYYEVTYTVEESLENCYSAGEYSVMVGVEESTTPNVQFEYEKVNYCPGDETLMPITHNDFTSGGRFIASPAGLSINDATGEIDLSSSNAGEYQVTYRIEEDIELCLLGNEHTVSISVAEDITFNLITYCEDNRFKIKAEFTNQSPNGVSYIWKDEAGAVLGQGETLDVKEAIGTRQLPIQISLFIESGDCVFTESILVDNTVCSIPEGFSPNGDGINDSFDLSFMNVRNLQVFSRYGNKVYTKSNYTNEWVGQDNSGNILPTGVYNYIIETKSGQIIGGWIYLNR